MIWFLLFAAPLLALAAWRWPRRGQPLPGAMILAGRLTGRCSRTEREEVWRAGDPLPDHIDLTQRGRRPTRIHLGDAVLESRWTLRRSRLRTGDRLVVEAIAVHCFRDDAGYRECAQPMRLEATRVLLGGLPGRRRCSIAMALAGLLIALLALLVPWPGTSPIALSCPPESRPRITPRPGGGWNGYCLRGSHLHGPVVEIDGRGIPRVEGSYRNGSRCGRWVWRDPRGMRRIEGHYRDGDRAGIWTTWWPNGQKRSEGHYRDDLQDGRWSFWDPRKTRREERFCAGWWAIETNGAERP